MNELERLTITEEIRHAVARCVRYAEERTYQTVSSAARKPLGITGQHPDVGAGGGTDPAHLVDLGCARGVVAEQVVHLPQ